VESRTATFFGTEINNHIRFHAVQVVEVPSSLKPCMAGSLNQVLARF